MNPSRNVWLFGLFILLLLAGCTQLSPAPAPSGTPWLEPAATTATIRIGVVPEAAHATIGSGAAYTPRDKVTGELGFRAYGGGWGHGVGMSQTGPVVTAEKRETFDEILAHYYRYSTLENRY